MLTKTVRSILLAMLVVMALTAIPVLAAPDSPETAASPGGKWLPIEPGEKHWYTFDYVYDEDRDYTGNQIFVDLSMEVANTVDFDVWSTDTIRKWAALEEFEPVGKGTYLLDSDNDNFDARSLRWVGGSAASDTFYVIVENRSQTLGYYLLNISGEGVSFPTSIFEMAEPVVPTEVAPEIAIAEPAGNPPGYGPAEALAPNSDWDRLRSGEIRWYAFKYNGTTDVDEQTQATVELTMKTEDGVSFEVWTAAQIPMWARGDDIDPIGIGTYRVDKDDDAFNARELSWVGAAPGPETYYVVVKNKLDGPSEFQLMVTGPDVVY